MDIVKKGEFIGCAGEATPNSKPLTPPTGRRNLKAAEPAGEDACVCHIEPSENRS